MGKVFVHGKTLDKGLAGDKLLPKENGEHKDSSSSLKVGESMSLTAQISRLFTSLLWGGDPGELLKAAALLGTLAFRCPWLGWVVGKGCIVSCPVGKGSGVQYVKFSGGETAVCNGGWGC